MNKKIKKGIIYGGSLALIGGITAGIAVPIVVAKNKVNNYNPLPGINEQTQITDNLNVQQINAALDSAGIEDKTLINKAEHATAFYLYDKEQKASLKYQKAKFRFQQYKQLNQMFQTLASNSYKDDGNGKIVPDTSAEYKSGIALVVNSVSNTLKFKQTLILTDGNPDYDAYKDAFDLLTQKIQSNIDLLANHDEYKDKYNSLKITLKNYDDNWNDADTGLESKIAKLDSGFAIGDYDADWFSSRYPDTLQVTGELKGSDGNWSGTGVYKNIAKIFMDERNSFLDSYATLKEGLAAWAKQLTKKYNGATSEAEAIETLVFNQVRNQAYASFNYSIIDSYTIDQLLSGVFGDIIGLAAKNAITVSTTKKLQYDSTIINNTKVKISKDPSRLNSGTNYYINNEDKIFFFGTKSNIAAKANPGITHLPKIISNNKMMQVQNAILGFKQGKSLLEGWNVSKDIIKDLLYVYANYKTSTKKTGLAADEYENIFKAGSEDVTKDLIARFSLTKDKTQWKSGDLGYMPGLDATKMAPGFGLGMLASYDDITNSGWFTKSKSITQTPSLLSDIRNAIVASFIKAGNDLGLATLGKTSVDESIFTQDNQQSINQFVDQLTDAQIKQYFGIAIRNVFNKSGGSVSDPDGIPQTFKISSSTRTGIYAFYSPAYGLHIVKINTSDFDLQNNLSNDLQTVANKQDKTETSTDYTSLFGTNYTVVNAIKDLLNDDDYKSALNAIKDYTPVGKDIATDVEDLINGLIVAKDLDKIQKSNWSKLTKYLIDQFDKGLIDKSKSLDPEKIYNAIKEMGGK